MSVKFHLAGGLLVWLAVATQAVAQLQVVTFTNYITITLTNVVTITNVVTVAPSGMVTTNRLMALAGGGKTNAAPGTNVVAGGNALTGTNVLAGGSGLNRTNAAGSLALAPAAKAAKAKITPTPKPRWTSTVTAGVTLTRGNSETLLATGKITTNKKTGINEFNLEGDATYGSASGVPNTELYHGFAQWNHLFSPKWYGFLRGEGLHDGIAQVKYQITLSSGVGYYLIKNTNTTLAAEAGPGIVVERLGVLDTTYATMRLAERFEHKFHHNGARIWENVEFLPQIDQPADYLINAEIGVESALLKDFDLQVYLDDNFNSQPAVGFRRNDVKLVSGVTYKF